MPTTAEIDVVSAEVYKIIIIKMMMNAKRSKCNEEVERAQTFHQRSVRFVSGLVNFAPSRLVSFDALSSVNKTESVYCLRLCQSLFYSPFVGVVVVIFRFM